MSVLVSYRSRARFVSCRARRDRARIVFASCMFCGRDRVTQVPYRTRARVACARVLTLVSCLGVVFALVLARVVFVSCKCCVRARAHLVFARVVSVCARTCSCVCLRSLDAGDCSNCGLISCC